jgi:4-aminobutyrate aminotransferase
VRACFERGLMVLPCGSNSIRFSPPLTITEAEADTAFAVFADGLAEVETRSL